MSEGERTNVQLARTNAFCTSSVRLQRTGADQTQIPETSAFERKQLDLYIMLQVFAVHNENVKEAAAIEINRCMIDIFWSFC